MKTAMTLVINGPNLDDYVEIYDCISDMIEGRVEGTITIMSEERIDDDGIDPYDGDLCNEVADLATESHIVPACACKRLREDYVYADIDWHNDRQVKVVGPISWVLPILRAAHGITR